MVYQIAAALRLHSACGGWRSGAVLRVCRCQVSPRSLRGYRMPDAVRLVRTGRALIGYGHIVAHYYNSAQPTSHPIIADYPAIISDYLRFSLVFSVFQNSIGL